MSIQRGAGLRRKSEKSENLCEKDIKNEREKEGDKDRGAEGKNERKKRVSFGEKSKPEWACQNYADFRKSFLSFLDILGGIILYGCLLLKCVI